MEGLADDSYEEESKYDLPLLANVREVLVRHYAINLSCDFEKKCLSGHVILFVELLQREETDRPFVFILDCRDIIVDSVESVTFKNREEINSVINNHESIYRKKNIDIWSSYEREKLNYEVGEWSLNIWSDKKDFPNVICINYSTKENGSSLTWSEDQNGRPCAFTQGSLINNRSLLPCQEPPSAMATWQAQFETESNFVVLTSGDCEADISRQDNGKSLFYYYTSVVLPMSTLALAIGQWKTTEIVSESKAHSSTREKTEDETVGIECLHENFPCYMKRKSKPNLIPCRLFATESLLEKAMRELSDYIPRCFEACRTLLGPHPFGRLDILVVPRCFGSLGLANPNLLFVSQSLFSGDGSMRIHLSHEICHSWFGLSIGALDWTEEWLSEGFATYMEDQVHALAMNWSDKEKKENSEIRSLLRYRLLSAEMENTDQELQVLRRESEEKSLTNGMNPWKCFSQVHYLKGYFLLRRLSSDVGEENFNNLLREYVVKHHGCLISSKQIFQLYFDRFQHVKTTTMENIYHDWLDYPGMPKELINFQITSDNSIYCRILEEVDKWNLINQNNLSRTKKLKLNTELNQFTSSDELVLFLEQILEFPRLSSLTLSTLNEHFRLDERNAHIRHRWLELVVKFDYRKGFTSVRQFLREDQSMGIYLYGELIHSRRKHHLNLARSCFEELRHEMDVAAKKTIKDMFQVTHEEESRLGEEDVFIA